MWAAATANMSPHKHWQREREKEREREWGFIIHMQLPRKFALENIYAQFVGF